MLITCFVVITIKQYIFLIWTCISIVVKKMGNDLSSLILERDGSLAIIVINEPPYNRLSLEFMDSLEALIPLLEQDNSVRSILIRGGGNQHFSVGMDLKQFTDYLESNGNIDSLLDQRLRILARIENLSKPVIAVLCGYCLGGGLELPLACHFRIAALDNAHIGLPEMDLGTVPAWGGSARLSRCVGRDHALDMILRGKKISGPKALEIGLVNEVWPNEILQEKALALAHELAKQPPLAVAGMLKALVNGEGAPLEEAIKLEREAVHKTMGSKHQLEGMQAFMQKRMPDFSGE